MTLNKAYRRQTWLINLLIGMLLVLGGLGLYGLAQSQASLDAIYTQRVLAMAQLAQNPGSAALTLMQHQANRAREDLADAARLRGWLRAAMLLTIVLGIGCAAACSSGSPRHALAAETEAPEAENAASPPVFVEELLETEPPTAELPADWDGNNRRGPNRARNVARIAKKLAASDGNATSSDRREAIDDWEPF